jgi:hypothetical protein
MGFRDIMTTTDPRRGRRSSKLAARRSSLPTTLPRPVKLTRDRTHTVSPPAHVRVLGVRAGGNSVTANVNASANTIEAAPISRMAGHSLSPRALRG